MSLGLGPRGANVNVSKRGLRKTVGLPGSGLSYQTFSAWNKRTDVASPAKPPEGHVPPPPSESSGPGRMLLVLGVLIALGLWIVWPASDSAPRSPTAAQPAATPAPAAAALPVEAPNRPLTADEVREAQTLLKALGFDPGGIDGIVGPMTIAAVKRYEPTRHWPVKGEVDLRLLESLRANKPGGAPAARPAPPPSPASPASPSGVTVVPSADMRLASRAIGSAGHPCGTVVAAVRLSDGSVRAVCSNGEIYRVFSVRGEWLAMKCSAVQRMGVEGC